MTRHQHINSTGFPLQLAIARAVKDQLDEWEVLYQEHAWKTDNGSGFIDLVIEWESRTWLMNIECKRVRESEWLFLRDTEAAPTRRHAKLWVTHFSNPGNCNFFDWFNVAMDPQSIESNMCIVAGQDPKSTPMLERIANTIVQSTEGLASAEAGLLSASYSGLRMYQNVIVTTAKLCVCDVDLKKINLSAGEIDSNSVVTEVPYLRFRKQVGASPSQMQESIDVHSLREYAKKEESTVFVVNADHFIDFVTRCSIDDDSVRRIGENR